MSGPLCFDDHGIQGWLPTVGRVRHITVLDAEPAKGTTVECLCGREFTTGPASKPHATIYDCTFCFQAWTEQHEPLAVPVQLSPQAAHTPDRGGQALPPLGVGDPAPAPSGQPAEATPCR